MHMERERESSIKDTDDAQQHSMLLLADDHNMDCVHDVKHTYRFSARFYGQILHAFP